MKKFRGVRKHHGKWVVEIPVSGKNKHIGCYNFHDDAVQARLDAEHKYGIQGITGIVKETPFKSTFVRTVYHEETDNIWIVAKDLLDALGYCVSNASRLVATVPPEFTGTINCNSHTKSYVGVTIEGALIMLHGMRTPLKTSMRKWLFSYLYPRTLQKVSDQLEVIRATVSALDESICR